MKVAFFGTSAFAVPILEALTQRADVALVVTKPERPASRGRVTATPVADAAKAHGLRIETPTKLAPLADLMRAEGIACCVVASYGRIVPQSVLDAAPMWLNVHPSALPLYRGATPIQSVIRDGNADTRVCVIAMDAGMDTGDVVEMTEPIPIEPTETYGMLHDRLALRGAASLVRALDAFADGTLVRRPQAAIAREFGITDDAIARTTTRPWLGADYDLATYQAALAAPEPRLTTAREVVDLIRAAAPKPGVSVRSPALGDFKMLAAHGSPRSVVAGGFDPALLLRVIARDGKLFVYVRDGTVVVDQLQPAGGKPMPMSAWANGHRISSDDLELLPIDGDLVAR